eukprot:scaffold82165_cov75-Phaeocystis_antarctica.AAC.3
MVSMFVTLDVSKVTGWLNDNATCRVEWRAHTVQGESRAGRRAARCDRGAPSSVTGALDC